MRSVLAGPAQRPTEMTAATTAPNFLVVFLVVLAFGVLDGAFGKLRSLYGQYDALFVARCEAHCWDRRDKSSCIKGCLAKDAAKPGNCPSKNTTLSPFAAACMKECHGDTQCRGIIKCCHHSCGVTCQSPVGLDSVKDLPEIPKDLKIVERRRKRTVTIEWSPGESSYPNESNGRIIYLIEERHQAGKEFIESALSEWLACSKALKTSHRLRNFVKPGRWYQFRVAAVNEKGTKGFSNSSLPFSISISPKPPHPPQNISVSPLFIKNGSLSAELRWTLPHSDLPIQKYKVFCSRRLHGAKALDSVLVRQHVVPQDQTHFVLHNLQPNSQYFLQVQALAQFGKERLRSEKSSLVLNTTEYTNGSDALVLEMSNQSRIDGLKLQKLFWSQGSLRARIVWSAKSNLLKYSIAYWIGPCNENIKSRSHWKFVATTKATQFDLKDLKFNCRYRVSIREISSSGQKSTQDTSITFTTPKCSTFREDHKKIRCN